MENREYLIEELEKISIDSIPSKILSTALKFRASALNENDEDEEIKLINYLVESHSIGSKLEANIISHKNTQNTFLENYTKNDFTSNPFVFSKEKIAKMLENIFEMPSEWTVFQITSNFDKKSMYEIFEPNEPELTKTYHTYFNCGQKTQQPFCITTTGGGKQQGDIVKKMETFKTELKEMLTLPFKEKTSNAPNSYNTAQKKLYVLKKQSMENKLKEIVNVMENELLGPAACLLVGKLRNNALEIKLSELIEEFLMEEQLVCTNKSKMLLLQAVKASAKFKQSIHMENLLETCTNSCCSLNSWNNFWKKRNVNVEFEETHPVILIIDECLDCLPWEMVPELRGRPTSRIPSLDLLHAIYKVHQGSIENGYKIVTNFKNGTYVLNPGSDLAAMEKRMKLFYDYWVPDWKGIVGEAPTAEDFSEAITTSTIFAYSGHGGGVQYCSAETIQKKLINAIVFLLGCGSLQTQDVGPEVEMFELCRRYFFSACPCVVGTLWVVTDVDLDLFTTKFFSNWLPNSEQKQHWNYVNLDEWTSGKKLKFNEKNDSTGIFSEPDLLKALNIGKSAIKYYCNVAAVIARGIPIRIVNKD